jgi:aldehyde:ferredoxin oxidoreductase
METDPEGNGYVVAFSEHMCEVVDSFSICKFPAVLLMTGKPSLLAKLYSYATGISMTMQESMKAGERIWNIEKAFNVRLGLSKKDDRLPKRILTEPATGGPYKGMKCEDYFEPMLIEYYKAHGWDPETSWPTRSKLEDLGLKYVADELEAVGRIGKDLNPHKKKQTPLKKEEE